MPGAQSIRLPASNVVQGELIDRRKPVDKRVKIVAISLDRVLTATLGKREEVQIVLDNAIPLRRYGGFSVRRGIIPVFTGTSIG